MNTEDQAKFVEELRRRDIDSAARIAKVHVQRQTDVLNTLAATPA